MPFVAPGLHEFTVLEVGPSLALIVDELAVREERPPATIERRPDPEGEVVHDGRREVLDVHRAAGQVDDRWAVDELADPHRAGRPADGGRQATIEGTAPDGDDRQGPAADLDGDLPEGPASDDAIDAAVGDRDRALDDGDVAVREAVHGLDPGPLGSGPGGGHERLVIVDGEDLEDEVADGRVRCSQEGLGVAGAVLALQPDDGDARGTGDGPSDPRPVGGRQGEGGGHQGPELEEATP